MAIIANFLALPFSAFSDPPGGGNDPFTTVNTDPSTFLSVSIDDDDNTIDGDTNSNETPNDSNQIATVTDANGVLVSSDACYVEWTATYTGTNGQVIEVWRIELDNGLRLFAMSEIPATGVQFTTSNKDQGADGLDPALLPQIPCFTAGTRIETCYGPQDISTLEPGDLVKSAYEKLLPLRWIGRRKLTQDELQAFPHLRPIRISAGAMGNGLPVRDLLVSRQHRMLVSSPVARRMFGSEDVLIAAIKLTELPGIYVDETVQEVEYIHLLFDQHEVILAEGSPSESLFTGAEALKSVSEEARQEIFTLFPELENGQQPVSARPIPMGRRQKQLVQRHLRNHKPLLACYNTRKSA